MVQPNAEQSLTLRERFLGPQSDEGFASLKSIVRVGSMALLAATGLAVSMGGYARQHSLTKTTTTIEGGHGEVTRVGTLPFPETYYGIIEDTVSGVTATADKKLFGFSIGDKAQVKLENGKYTMKIGNGPLDLNYAPGKDGKKVSIKFPLDKLLATVYQTDPTQSGMVNDNGAIMAIRGNAENLINVIPKLGTHDVNETYNRLSGLVLLDAYKISVEKCAPNAWSYLQPIYFKDVTDYTVAQVNAVHPNSPITANDVEILPIGEPKFTSQYQKQFDSLNTRNEANGDHFIVESTMDKVDCSINEGVLKQTSSAIVGNK